MSDEPQKYVPPNKRRGTEGNVVEIGGDVRKVVETLNRDHALVLAGADSMILFEGVDAWGAPEVRFLKVGAFRIYHGNHFIDTGKRDPKTYAEAWLESPMRRQYLGVCMAPEGAPPDYYNLWHGFDVEPHEGDVSLFERHVYEVMADGNREAGDYIIGWFADIVQNPGVKCETALVLRGDEGSGKSLPGTIVGSLMPQHYVQIHDPRFLFGQFNEHMKSCILLQSDEGFWAGDKKTEGQLKGLITSDVHFIERKQVDAFKVRNLIRLMITTNNDWAVPAGYGSRRWAVFDVSSSCIGDRAYFDQLVKWGQSEAGRSALLHYLLSFDLGMVDLKRIPDTEALFEQRVSTLSDQDAWWLSRLQAGTLLPHHEVWESEVPAEALWDCYARYADKIGVKRKQIATQLGIALKRRLLPPGWPRKSRGYVVHQNERGEPEQRRVEVYRFPPLDECRRHFQERLGGHAIDWGDE